MGKHETKTAAMPATRWAVGHTVDASRVALQLNGDTPVVLQAEEAIALATALRREAETIAVLRPKR
jgi:hypothetical protein